MTDVTDMNWVTNLFHEPLDSEQNFVIHVSLLIWDPGFELIEFPLNPTFQLILRAYLTDLDLSLIYLFYFSCHSQESLVEVLSDRAHNLLYIKITCFIPDK